MYAATQQDVAELPSVPESDATQQGFPKVPAKAVEQECPGYQGDSTTLSSGVADSEATQQGSPEVPAKLVEQECPGHQACHR